MNRRIVINVAVFAAISAIMTVWAFRNVITFDFIERPYHVTAVFESSPGLHPNFEVDYLGIRIGKIDSVRLRGDRVHVKLDIDRGTKIPAAVTAAAARKSAVGEPVVELTPKPGAVDGPELEPGAVITDTSVPPRYGDLFGAVNKIAAAIDPQDVSVLTRELALGWNGRAESLRQIIGGSDQLTGTFAADTELIDGLTKDLGKITQVLAQNRGSLGSGVDDLAAVTGALREVRTELVALRDEGPGLIAEVNRLLTVSGPDLDCSLDALGSFVPALTNRAGIENVRGMLSNAPELKYALDRIIGEDEGRKVLNVVFLLTTNTPATLEYEHPLPQPKVGKIPNCSDGRAPGAVKQDPFVGKDPGTTIPRHDPSIQSADRPAAKTAGRNAAGGPPMWLVYIPPVLALLVLLRVAARSAPVLARRRRPRD